MKDVGLLAVVGALHDGQQVVLALGQQGGRDPDMVHVVVDAPEADADQGGHGGDQGEQRRADDEQGALDQPPAGPPRRRRRGRPRPRRPRGDRDRQRPPSVGRAVSCRHHPDLRSRTVRRSHCLVVALRVRCGCRGLGGGTGDAGMLGRWTGPSPSPPWGWADDALDDPLPDDRPRRQGLDLGPGATMSRVRLRRLDLSRRRGGRARSGPTPPPGCGSWRPRPTTCAVVRAPDRWSHPRIRLPRARRLPPLRRASGL